MYLIQSFLRTFRRRMSSFESEREEMGDAVRTKWELTVKTEADKLDGGWIAQCVDLPGCVSQGETEEEALENLIDAISGVVAVRISDSLGDIKGHDSDRGIRRLALSI